LFSYFIKLQQSSNDYIIVINSIILQKYNKILGVYKYTYICHYIILVDIFEYKDYWIKYCFKSNDTESSLLRLIQVKYIALFKFMKKL